MQALYAQGSESRGQLDFKFHLSWDRIERVYLKMLYIQSRWSQDGKFYHHKNIVYYLMIIITFYLNNLLEIHYICFFSQNSYFVKYAIFVDLYVWYVFTCAQVICPFLQYIILRNN